ncbi:MAG: M42 family metallopeptidase [Chloroflexi bacterium]|nr:M42 family metallopeptidase [Chloroflexota bacterium]
MQVIPFLRELSAATGIAGREHGVRTVVQEAWRPLVDEIREDKLGNLIALKRGSGSGQRPRLMLAAHMDEVGLVVTGIDSGFLRIAPVGGADRRVLPGLEVVVHGQRDLPGIVATRPPHVLSSIDRQRTIPWDKLFVDVGLPEATVRQNVAVGDLISIQANLLELQNRRVAAKALDDRACVAAVTMALEQLGPVRHTWDILAVATTQEEIGLKGATTATYGIGPDLAIALDVTFGAQPGAADTDTFPLGEGPTLGIGPNFHPKFTDYIRQLADRHEFPYHIEATPGVSGTDAWAIQVALEGIPTALLSLPIRYMHQPIELLDTQDIERTGRLLATIIAELDDGFLSKLAWDIGAEDE